MDIQLLKEQADSVAIDLRNAANGFVLHDLNRLAAMAETVARGIREMEIHHCAILDDERIQAIYDLEMAFSNE